MWADWRPPSGVEDLEFLEGNAQMLTPGEVSEYTVRRFATMFGAIPKLELNMVDEDEEGWRLIAAEEYGATTAQEEARGWLSA